MRARDQLVARLVESDVSVGADAQELKVDAARRFDFGFIAGAFGVEIIGCAVEKVDLRRVQTHRREQMLVHEPSEASRMGRADAGELIEIERPHAPEIHLSEAMHPAQLRIGRHWTLPRRQSQHQVGLLANSRRNSSGQGPRQFRPASRTLGRSSVLRSRRDTIRRPTCGGQRERHGALGWFAVERADVAARGHFSEPRRHLRNQRWNPTKHSAGKQRRKRLPSHLQACDHRRGRGGRAPRQPVR